MNRMEMLLKKREEALYWLSRKDNSEHVQDVMERRLACIEDAIFGLESGLDHHLQDLIYF